MSINKLALIRYKTIDNCLKNRGRKWTLDDLVEACSEAIYEYEGIDNGVSKRTVQLDLQNMRSEKLGYNAPIIVVDKKYYTYEDKNYSITNTPLTNQDLSKLNEVVQVLKQFKGFSYFEELTGMITKLENKVFTQQNEGKSFIQFEKNDLVKGLGFIDPIHKAILKEAVLNIEYQSFKASKSQFIKISPYLLKEFRNRWFVLCQPYGKNGFLNLALDRILSVEELGDVNYIKPKFDMTKYYDDTIGVTKSETQRGRTVVLKILNEHLPYIVTKPLHSSQKILKQELDGTLFSIVVVHNFELEKEILGFGEIVKVLAPRNLKTAIERRIKKMTQQYQKPSSDAEGLEK
jgi:predicted DNA-binding transcriptional regulator YafY